MADDYLRKGGYIFAFVCLSISRITKKNCRRILILGGVEYVTNDSTLVVIQITIRGFLKGIFTTARSVQLYENCGLGCLGGGLRSHEFLIIGYSSLNVSAFGCQIPLLQR